MQTLGLTGETKRSDGRLKSIFWPTVENAWDVDDLGRQGFWICCAIAVIQLLVVLFFGSPLLVASSFVTSLVFAVGGMGVRQSNWFAAVITFSLWFINIVYAAVGGQFPGFLTFIIAAILLSNVRATFLSSKWQPAAEGDDKPTRFDETLFDKISDQIPPRLWPVLRVPYFVVSILLMLLSGFGLLIRVFHVAGAVPRP